MRTRSVSLHAFGAITRRIYPTIGLAIFAATVLAVPASAHSSGPPVYSLRITEGETTLPENPIEYTSGNASDESQIQVSIVRGGLVIARSHPNGGYTGMSQVPQAGESIGEKRPDKPLTVLDGADLAFGPDLAVQSVYEISEPLEKLLPAISR